MGVEYMPGIDEVPEEQREREGQSIQGVGKEIGQYNHSFYIGRKVVLKTLQGYSGSTYSYTAKILMQPSETLKEEPINQPRPGRMSIKIPFKLPI